jgi:hypothetical protein
MPNDIEKPDLDVEAQIIIEGDASEPLTRWFLSRDEGKRG